MIIVKLKGGLGNQMFEYALGRHLALINNTELILDLTFLLDRSPGMDIVFRDFDLDIFKIKAKTVNTYKHDFYIKKSIPYKFLSRIGNYWNYPKILRNIVFNNHLIKEQQFHFDVNVLKAPKHCYIDGFWQSPKYFNSIENVIREDFELKDDFPYNFEELIGAINRTESVCINVRRADFVTNNHNGTMGISYYENAIELIEKKYSNPHFFVFSDDIDWCIKNIKPLREENTVVVSHQYSGDKFKFYLKLMQLCKHFIIPNSTFAWWAAWLADNPDKTVIAPQKWFLFDNRNTSDIYLDDWIVI